MKKILSTFAIIAFALAANAQTTILDYAALWNKKANQIRLEVAIQTVADDILNTPADSALAIKAVNIVLSSNVDAYKRRFMRQGVERQVNPDNLTDTQLIAGVRSIFVFEYWAERLRNGEISATQFYINTQ